MTEPHDRTLTPGADAAGLGEYPRGDRRTSPRNGTGSLLAIGIGGLVVGLIIGGIGGFAIGSGEQDSSTAGNSQAPRGAQSDSTSAPEASGQDRDFPGKNIAVEAPGVTLTVLGVEENPQASIREEGRRADAAEILTTEAASGQKYVTITTEVENTGKVPWDLTCGAAIQATLFDPEERQFAAIDELYRVPGNPECNASTQPGQTVPMTWRYEVPESVVPKFFGFREFGVDIQADHELTAIDLDR